jgi:tetratricopeptide (TPR) repeat protein
MRADQPSAEADRPLSETVDAAPAAPALLRRRIWDWLKSLAWPLVCLFQLGLIAAAFGLGSQLTNPEIAPPSEPAPTVEEKTAYAPAIQQEPLEPEPNRAAQSELDEVDRLIRMGRYELALGLCRSYCDRAVAELRDAFQYRLGLCLEGLGHWDESLACYRRLASHTGVPRTAAIALLGQARVWLRMRRPGESKALLCDLLRRSALPDLREQPFLADARYLLALAAPLEILPNQSPGPFHDNPVTPLTSDWSLERALDWDKPATTGGRKDTGDSSRTPDPSPPAPDAEIIEVRIGQVLLVRIFVHQMPITSLLDRLAEQARLRIEWSARARQQVEGRGVIVALERTAMAEALRVLAEPMGLVWEISGDKLSFKSDEEVSAEQLRALRWSNARQALREAVLTHHRHPLTPAAYLELGDLEAVAGHVDEALVWFGRLIREWPRSPLVVEGQYNLGLLRKRQGDRPSARQAFYHVVDRAPAHELAPLAYWRIGCIYLEEGDAEQALSPLRRALRSGPGSPAHGAAVVTMAAAHLLTDNPRAANAVLLENRELVAHEHYRNAAAFLDTLARYQAATERRQRQREAGDLLAALLAVRDDPLLGAGGLALMGQAYQELGMQEEMVRVYEKALPLLRGPLAAELALALADAYRNGDRPEEAVKLYGRVIAGGPSGAARRARMRLAEIALADKKPQACLKACHELLQEKAGVDVPAVLRLMAGAHEQLGERDKAIRCLEGKLP